EPWAVTFRDWTIVRSWGRVLVWLGIAQPEPGQRPKESAMLFQYFCKKNGQNIELEVESLPSASMEYIVKKGLREYFDNYHASVTKDGMKTAKGTTPWTSQDEYLATVKEYLTEAFDRLRAGDVASGRQ